MNFIDKAFAQHLAGDDFLQAMASVYSEPEVYEVLCQYPLFVADVISIIDYDTAIQINGLDDIINRNLSERYLEIVDALKRCGAAQEANVLQKAKILSDTDRAGYEKQYEALCSQIVLNNDYESFWDTVRRYIVKNLAKTK